MTLSELIQKVEERNLTKDQLEEYRDNLSHLFAKMMMELSEKEKSKALFFDQVKKENEKASDVSIKRLWLVTKDGQREIELKRYCLATKEILNSLRNRLYNFY